jgi:hypothetical protein
MHRKFALMFSMFLCLDCCQLLAQSGPERPPVEIPGICAKWIVAAFPEFKKEHLDLANYRVTVEENNDSVTVVLRSNDDKEGYIGSSGSHPDFEVEVRKKDLKILHSNYER